MTLQHLIPPRRGARRAAARLAGAALVAATLVAAPVPAATATDTIYFADIVPGFSDGSIRKINTDGTGLETVLTTGAGIRSLDIDPVARRIYWTDVDNLGIHRADLDGSNRQLVVSENLAFPSAIAVDPAGGRMYWGDQLTNHLRRANLDGSGGQLLRSTPFHRGVAVDHAGGKVYWSTSNTTLRGEILRSNLDGSSPQVVVTSPDTAFKPNAIALDIAGGKVYWTDYTVDVVRRANLDGTEIETLYAASGNFNPRGIALDLAEGKVYWGQDIDFDGTSGMIMRMNLDGSLPETVALNLGLVNSLAILRDKPACPVDFNNDGAVNSADFFEFLSAFFAQDPAADFNADGTVNSQDFFDFLAAFFAGCP